MKKFFLLLLTASSLMSCYHVYYAPNTPTAPLFSEKDEMRVNALYATGNESEYNGGELQVAYAVTGNWGVLFNGFAVGRSELVDGVNTQSGKGTYAEFGAGYFIQMDQKGQWIFETYGGFGGGNVKNEYSYGDRSRVGITKFYLQPAIGYKSKHFEFAFITRVAYVNWKVKQQMVGSNVENQWVLDDMVRIRSKPGNFSFEPALILRAGGKSVKAHAGLTFRRGNYLADDLTEHLNASLGLSFSFSTRKNKS